MTRAGNSSSECRVWLALSAGAVIALAIGMLLAPDLDKGSIGKFAQLFGTCAQVVAALLIVIAVEVNLTTFRGLDLHASAVKAGLGSGCLALVAALAALSPSLPEWIYEPCFAVAMAGALGSLVTVIIVGVKAIDQAREGAELADVRLRAVLGNEDARRELLELGESVPRP